jgi:hypothetical protein
MTRLTSIQLLALAFGAGAITLTMAAGSTSAYGAGAIFGGGVVTLVLLAIAWSRRHEGSEGQEDADDGDGN